ncbi:MAG: hypothetical protein PHI01_04740, partial [Candidatus Izemoplasmatales bacterium]|nr:hypothetical protein [Candidatus Izemoplasmatales bacterium]
MVFVKDTENEDQNVWYLSEYRPYWNSKHMRVKNPDFDEFSGEVLGLKQNKPESVNQFFDIINSLVHKGIVICVVPSHDPDSSVSGITLVAQRLARNDRFNGTECLHRKYAVQKLADGG